MSDRVPPTLGWKCHNATAEGIHQGDRSGLAVGGGGYSEEQAQGDQFIVGADIGRWERRVGRYPLFVAPRDDH